MGAERPDEQPDLEAVQREIDELRASRARLAKANDAERRDIERALHGGVQQDLTGIAANLEVLATSIDADPVAAKALLEELRREATRALTESRELAGRIFPPLLEAGGLVPELRAAAARAHVRIAVEAPAAGGLPPALAAPVYFCALDMVDRAPAGTTISVLVRDEEGAIAFEVVADADLGSDRRAAHDRIEALGGSVSITAADGRTTIAGSLPR
jgi:signal transduction histidine kinase